MRRILASLLAALCLGGIALTVATAPSTVTAENPCNGPIFNPDCDDDDPAPLASNPTGVLDQALRQPGGILVSGWVDDPDRAGAAMTVAVEIDGQWTNISAALARSDGAVGFRTVVPTTLSGNLSVCAPAFNVAAGNDDTSIG